jgi:hypothetical protein
MLLQETLLTLASICLYLVYSSPAIKQVLNRLAFDNYVPDGPKRIIAEFAAPTPRFPGSNYAWEALGYNCQGLAISIDGGC